MAFSTGRYIGIAKRLWRHPLEELKRKLGASDFIPHAFVAKFIPPNPVVLEAGAANGTDTLVMSQLWPRGLIYAVEPIPLAYEQLRTRCAGLTNVRTHQLAFSDRDGMAEMFVSEGPSRTDSSSLAAPTGHSIEIPAVKFPNRVKVPTVRIDDWVRSNGIERIDLMWLDLQGYELTALKHGTDILKTVSVVHMEISQKEMYAGTPLYPEVKRWMEQQGFVVAKEALLWPMGNVLFVKQHDDRL